MALRIKRRKRTHGEFPTIDLDKLEIMMSETKRCGSYDQREIRNQTVQFRDDRHGKTCYVRFQDGHVFLREKKD